MSTPATPRRERMLAASARIGEALVGHAYTWQGRCNWMGHAPDAPWRGVAALGGSLYRGTAGVGLFLARLAEHTPSPRLAAVAGGALRHALTSWSGPAPDTEACGLHDGWTGAALAAMLGGRALGDEAVFELGRARLIEAMGGGFRRTDGFDFVSGRAGAIVALLEGHRLTGDPALRGRAEALGAELMALALVDDEAATASWKAPADFGIPTSAPLTGLAHGAAGAAVALLSLAKVTRNPRATQLARQAFAYEAQAGDAASGRWPDFRLLPNEGRPGRRSAPAWCHGAAGSGLARAAALEFAKREGAAVDDALVADARDTLRVMREVLASGADDPDSDLGLCHGLAGLILCTQQTAAAIGETAAEEEAARVAESLAEAVLSEQGPVARALLDPGCPALMTGAAGTGYALLRLGGGLPPSPLLAM